MGTIAGGSRSNSLLTEGHIRGRSIEIVLRPQIAGAPVPCPQLSTGAHKANFPESTSCRGLTGREHHFGTVGRTDDKVHMIRAHIECEHGPTSAVADIADCPTGDRPHRAIQNNGGLFHSLVPLESRAEGVGGKSRGVEAPSMSIDRA